MSAYLKNNPTTILIVSHTDATGSEAFNKVLSQERADLIRDRLIGQGVDPALLIATGVGSAEPLLPDDPESERNRRTEFVIADNMVIGPFGN